MLVLLLLINDYVILGKELSALRFYLAFDEFRYNGLWIMDYNISYCYDEVNRKTRRREEIEGRCD